MRLRHAGIPIALLFSVVGCASLPNSSASSACVERHGVTITEGRPRPVIDGVGWVVGIPEKILLWDRRVENHHVSDATEESIACYLNSRGLNDVQVRVNEYDPAGEWSRLRQNKRMGAGWRYTVGALSVAGYTVFPGRVFGGDKYNPYTNSLYVYSDVPSLGLVHGAYAYDIHQRSMPGAYAFSQEFPFLSLYKETLATNEALEYLQVTGQPSEIHEGYRILHPRYGAEIGSAADSIFAGGPVFQIAGAVVGHATGRWKGHPYIAPEETQWNRSAETEREFVSVDQVDEQSNFRAQNEESRSAARQTP